MCNKILIVHSKYKLKVTLTKFNIERDTPKKLALSDAFIIKFEACTGTLIADDWILSAAHCFEDQPKSDDKKNKYGDYEVINKSVKFILSFVARSIPLHTVMGYIMMMIVIEHSYECCEVINY